MPLQYEKLCYFSESTLTCLKGDNLPIARDCNTVQQCGSHEVHVLFPLYFTLKNFEAYMKRMQ